MKNFVRIVVILAVMLCRADAQTAFGPHGNGITTCFGNLTAVVGACPSVIPAVNNIAANWANAGLATIGGIPTRATQCGSTVNPSGLTPPQSGDDAALITAAISACTAGDAVQLGSGTFNFAQSELPIVLNKGITLRGSGSTVGSCDASAGTPCWPTVLQTYDGPQPTYQAPAQCGVTIGSVSNCPNGSGMFLVAPQGLFLFGWSACDAAPSTTNPTTSSCGTTLTADASQGDTTVHVTSTSNFSTSMWVLIDENPQMVTTTNPTGGSSIQASPEFLNTTNSAVMKLANPDSCSLCTYSFVPNRLNQELHLVTGVNSGAGTLTFDDPLTLAFRQSGSHDARVYWPTLNNSNTANPFLQQASIENMTLTRCNGGCINFEFCALCWVKNVEANYWIGGAVNFVYSARSEVTGSYLHNCIDCQNNGEEYPLGISTSSTEILVDNNIITFGGKGMVGRGANSAVIAYNYFDKTFYEQAVIGDYWNDMGANGSHYGGTHHFLFEGNWATNCDGDETHGNAIDHTFFRNQCNGGRNPFVDPSDNALSVNDCNGVGYATSAAPTPPAPLRAAGPMAFNYWYAFVDNVLGYSGMQSCSGGSYVYGATSAERNRSIWLSGWVGSEWPGPDANLDGSTARYIFKNGNYDYVNAGIVDYATGYSHTFPNSLFLSSEPAYFTAGASATYTWPWIDATSGTPVKTNSLGGSGLPAKARADAGTPFEQP